VFREHNGVPSSPLISLWSLWFMKLPMRFENFEILRWTWCFYHVDFETRSARISVFGRANGQCSDFENRLNDQDV